MSAEATTWAYGVDLLVDAVDPADREYLKMGPKFLLVTLANYADQEHSCFPAMRTLAGKMGCSLTSVKEYLGTLRDVNLVTVEKRRRPNGSQSSSRFYLPVGAWVPRSIRQGSESDLCAAPVDNSPRQGSDSDRGGVGIRPPLNRNLNRDSSSSVPEVTTDAGVDNSEAASGGDGRISTLPTPTTLARFHGHAVSTPDVFASIGEILAPTHLDDEGLLRLADEILAVAPTRVLNPTAYVVKALRNPSTQHEWVARAWAIAGDIHLERAARRAG